MANTREIQHVVMSEANTLGILNPLVSFNCIIDTDFGLLTLIAQKFFDTSVFSEEFFNNNYNVESLKKSVYNREDKNPLLLCMKSPRNSDNYYKQFTEEQYGEILQRSMITDLPDAMYTIEASGAVFTILCKYQSEIDLLDSISFLKKYNKILVDNVDLNMFNQIFIKSLDDYGMDKIKGTNMLDKKIYLARYKFNNLDELDEEDSKMLILLDRLRCEITKFDLYFIGKENSDNGS